MEFFWVIAVKFFLKNKISLSPNRFSPCGFFLGMLPKIYWVWKFHGVHLFHFLSLKVELQQCLFQSENLCYFQPCEFSGFGNKLSYFRHLNWRMKLSKNLHGIRAEWGRKLIFADTKLIFRIHKSSFDSSNILLKLDFWEIWLQLV